MKLELYRKLEQTSYQRTATAPKGNSDRRWDMCNTAGRPSGPEDLDPEDRESTAGVASEHAAPEVALAALSAETRRSCAACQTLHGDIRPRQRREHSEQRPREFGV